MRRGPEPFEKLADFLPAVSGLLAEVRQGNPVERSLLYDFSFKPELAAGYEREP